MNVQPEDIHSEAVESSETETPLQGEEVTVPNQNGGGSVVKKEKKPLGKRILKALAIITIILLAVVIIALATVLILFRVGQSRMLSNEDFTPQFPQPGETTVTAPTEPQATEETTEPDRILMYDDGKTVSYKGEDYVYNENIATVLLIGVDKEELEDDTIRGEGGEADTLLLLAMDTKTGKSKIVGISRETYAQVDIYSVSDNLLESRNTQICRSYAFGDGGTLSCENTIKSVRRLLYGMPIHSYVALDIRIIAAATNAVGGVTLTALSDVWMPGNWIAREGTEITLWGQEADSYVRNRDHSLLESNLLRMERQRQFVEVFAQKALSQSKKDLSTLLELYNAMTEYMNTDLTAADVAFLLGTFLNHGATFEFSSLEGRMDTLDGYAIYYPDETNIYETILDLYYTKIEP